MSFTYSLFRKHVNIQSRYFEVGYSRCNLRNLLHRLSQFHTTKSMVDPNAKHILTRQSGYSHLVQESKKYLSLKSTSHKGTLYRTPTIILKLSMNT